jgi:endo-1,4-beta-xylanase
MRIKLIFSVLLALTLIIPTCFAAEEPKEKTREERLAEAQAKITPEAINTRIEEIRMGNIIVNTRPNSTVKIQQVRHEFLFGTAIPSGLEATGWRPMSEEDREMYLQVLEENFNYAVHENALKWDSIEYNKEGVDYSVPDKIWEMCNERNIPMRGHCIFWAKDKFNRPWVQELNSDELRGRVINRAIDLTRHYKGRIEEFDLNNEMIFGDFFRRRLGLCS